MSNKTTVAVKRRHLPELNIGLVDGVAHTFLTSFDDVNFLLGQTGKRTSGSWVKRLEKLKLVPYHIKDIFVQTVDGDITSAGTPPTSVYVDSG